MANEQYEVFKEKLERLMMLSRAGGEQTSLDCSSCGDNYTPLVSKITGDKCPECYAEINLDHISTDLVNLRMFGGGRATKDDTSPWQENAIRILEDNR